MMYIAALGFFFGLAAAQVATTTSPADPAASTDLPGLIAQLPPCAFSCIATAAKEIGCSATGFSCLCNSQQRLINSLTPCVLSSGCSTTDIASAAKLAPEICGAVLSNPDSSAIASASNLVTGALASATSASATTANPTVTPTPNSAVRREYGVGVFGAAAVAAALL